MKQLIISIGIVLSMGISAQTLPPSGATETTPARSEYFSWINNTNEGATARQTEINLDFFKWLKETYGMQLDIYAFDAGAIDGSKIYGSMESERFKRQFPNGFGPLSKRAQDIGTSFGLWGGPDGFGDTPQQATKRIDMMVKLVKDYGFRLFKMDAVCGQLRSEKYGYFDTMFQKIRSVAPELILLNHRLDLGPGTKYSTTYLLGGAETYIDVHMRNTRTAVHHRLCALERKNPENLTRLTEDHGVCLSSCLDYWEDDLILQAFNRNLILAPEIYGNPWFLRDDEYPYLAYIFNLHRDYRDILAREAKRLPEERYGYEAISRGDRTTRFITLRNLTWEAKKFTIALGEETGLDNVGKDLQVRLYHPYIFDMGKHPWGSSVEVEVAPFRSALVKITSAAESDPILISGIRYRIVNDRIGDKAEIKLLGKAGEKYTARIRKGSVVKTEKIVFQGTPLKDNAHRKIADMKECEKPEDIDAVYYATCFAADNNALEVRCLERSGKSSIPEVTAARDAFFNQKMFTARSVWDKYMFDGDPKTDFAVSFQFGDRRTDGQSSLMLDMGECIELDKLNFTTYDEYSLFPLKTLTGSKAYVSSDLKDWKEIVFLSGVSTDIYLKGMGPIRYVRLENAPLRITEINGYTDGKAVDRSKWRASNLFQSLEWTNHKIDRVWSSEFTLQEIPEGSYLCIAIEGKHGIEGAWAGFKVDGQYRGCPDRAPSFQCNPWECPSSQTESGYTYFLPLDSSMIGEKIEAFAMSLGTDKELKPQIWITAYPEPLQSITKKY